MIVDIDTRGRGVGTVLKQAQRISAGQAGYSAVVSETSSSAVKAITTKLGGQLENDSYTTWTLLPTRAQDTRTQDTPPPGEVGADTLPPWVQGTVHAG